MTLIRIDKFISERTEYSRSEIKNLASKGKILLNGQPVRKSDLKIDADSSQVTICGKSIPAQRYKYLLMNKPSGYVCSTDNKDGETVMKLIPPDMRTKDMFPAGRLDKDSLGALLITDDGELAHNILSPKKHISKIYIVKLDRPFENKYVDIFTGGLKLSDNETCLPAKLKRAESSDKLAFVELREGKYHQIKRMFATVGNHVEILMRISLGGLILPEKLAFGQCIELLHKDVENLFCEPDFDDFCSRFSADFSAILINK